jgi:tripartite-type tricarboxylate transporter receptor subunit TctC
MRINRRTFLTALVGAALADRAAWAQDSQTRPVRLIVPRAPGGGSDNLARVLSGALKERLGQTIVVENRPDATAIVGAEVVMRAQPDGLTLYLSDNSFYQNPAFLPHVPYDTIRDFTAVTVLAQSPLILIVHPAVPVRSVKELIAYAKANPGKLNFASGGIGSSGHFAGVLFNLRAGTDMTHVPFKSAGPALAALLGNQVQLQYGGISSARPLIADGRVRALAVSGRTRDPAMPEVPTVREAGLEGLEEILSTFGIHAPAKTPLTVRRRLRDAIVATMAEPAIAQRMREMGYTPVGNTPEEHQRQTEELIALWIDVGRRVELNK